MTSTIMHDMPASAECDLKSILLAEDDRTQERLFREALVRADFPCRLEVVRDGVEMIDYLFGTGDHKGRDTRVMPDLILLDLKMPRMDGIQVLKVLRRVRGENQPRLPPIVVLTCSDHDDDIAAAYQWGAQSYIRKPDRFDDLVAAVRETMRYWLNLNQPLPPRKIRLSPDDDIVI